MDYFKIKNSFNKSALYYDKWANVQKKCAEIIIDKLEKFNLKKVNNILELGCGTGNLTKLIDEKIQYKNFISIDCALNMLKIASDKVKRKNIYFINANIHELSKWMRKKTYFDIIISNASFQWIKDHDKLAISLKNILKENGRVIFTYFPPDTYKELKLALNFAFNQKIKLASDEFASLEVIKNVWRRYYSSINVEKFKFDFTYSSIIDLLKVLKKTGVNVSYNPSLIFTRKKIKDIEDFFIKNYGRIIIKYKVYLFTIL